MTKDEFARKLQLSIDSYVEGEEDDDLDFDEWWDSFVVYMADALDSAEHEDDFDDE